MPMSDPRVLGYSALSITGLHIVLISGSFAISLSLALPFKQDTTCYQLYHCFCRSKQTKNMRDALLLLTTAAHAVASSPFNCVSCAPKIRGK